jgi:3-isopropylmalate/(R)-2-methylmalate dehydratase small subunit
MDAFHTHTGIAVPLRRSNVDTDQIIPAVYLKRVTRTGFEDGLFAAWRADPSFVLNLSPFDRGSVLVAGPDFGTGSSREHAVWALMDYGFRVVISSRFGDIFRGNAGKAGLLAAEVAQDDVELLWKLIESSPGLELTVNLQDRNVAAGTVVVPFNIDDYTAWRLLEGLDDIALTLRKRDQIALEFRALQGRIWRLRHRPSAATGFQKNSPEAIEIARGSWKSGTLGFTVSSSRSKRGPLASEGLDGQQSRAH